MSDARTGTQVFVLVDNDTTLSSVQGNTSTMVSCVKSTHQYSEEHADVTVGGV